MKIFVEGQERKASWEEPQENTEDVYVALGMIDRGYPPKEVETATGIRVEFDPSFACPWPREVEP